MISDWAGYLKFRAGFEEATDPEEYPIEWLDHQVAVGTAWPIIGKKAAVVVEFKQYPGGARAVHGLVAAGDINEIANSLIPAAEEMGRRSGCKYGLIESREGWARVLKNHGYEVRQVTLRKEL